MGLRIKPQKEERTPRRREPYWEKIRQGICPYCGGKLEQVPVYEEVIFSDWEGEDIQVSHEAGTKPTEHILRCTKCGMEFTPPA